MTEIFYNISKKQKDNAEFIFNLALQEKDILSTLNLLNTYTNFCPTEEEQKFIEFYFNMRLEQLKNENNNDKR